MEFFNILATTITYEGLTTDISLNFIGKFIEWLINISNVGIGIILFTLALKLIAMPFDIYSKIKSKQNAVKMEAMRGDLEKLQKQYAHDKNLYNQKMMALQKKNGYSPMSGCLPMILSLVIFIIAINAFRTYSAYSMQNEYNDIVKHYNIAVEELTVNGEDSDMFTVNENGLIEFKDKEFIEKVSVKQGYSFAEIKEVLKVDAEGKVVLNVDENGNFKSSANSIIENLKTTNILFNHSDNFQKQENNDYYSFLCDASQKEEVEKDTVNELLSNLQHSFFENNYKAKVDEEVKKAYESGEIMVSKFLWVKNVWLPDVSYKNPIEASYKDFQTSITGAAAQSCSCGKAETIGINEKEYNTVTAGLYKQKEAANGYFILVALSILTMFLSQFIAQKMQKSQLELQSVDGQAAMTQKMMMWMMPVMFGVFAFQYSSAFSIYMTISSLVSTASSSLINILVEKKFNKGKVEEEGRSKKNINQIEKAKVEAAEKAKQLEIEKEQKRQERKNFFKKK